MTTDYSSTFALIRPSIFDVDGNSYTEMRKGFQTRWTIVWLDMAVTLVVGLTLFFGMILISHGRPALQMFILIPGSALCGLVLHKMTLFLHESSHFNIAPNRLANDCIANIYIARLLFTSAKEYRVRHLRHHRFLGEPNDPERSYFLPITWRRMFGALCGVSAVQASRTTPDETEPHSSVRNALVGLILHVAIIVLIYWLVGVFGVVLWSASAYSWMPFWTTLRQTLEHRSPEALGNADYRSEPHGAFTRNFDHVGAFLLGGVGFRDHLIHHWDPGISYTQLSALRHELENSLVGPILRERTSSYSAALRGLLT